MSELRVVDSSGWLEYLADSDRADYFSKVIEDPDQLIVPVISVYEVYNKTLRDRGADRAREAVEIMRTGRVVMLDLVTAIHAATFRLAIADSLIYAVTIQ